VRFRFEIEIGYDAAPDIVGDRSRKAWKLIGNASNDTWRERKVKRNNGIVINEDVDCIASRIVR
jgi:hypothetical protein